jgi:hypothetical protein
MEVAIGSNATTIKLDDVVASLLLKKRGKKPWRVSPRMPCS